MFKTVRTINEKTSIVTDGMTDYVAKKIFPDDIEIYETLAKLPVHNPNIAKVRGVFVIDDELCAVRDYIEGVTLGGYIEKYGPITAKRAKMFTEDICNGLTVVHALGMVHRDISPSNIIIDPIGNAVIIDFSISRTVKPGKSADTMILGTQGFAAPEQFGFNQTDSRADIYAVGALLNYMLTGKLPNEETAPGPLGKVVLKCTKPDPSDRYRSTREIVFAMNHPVLGVNIFCYIPGYRSGNLRNGVIATVYYLFIALYVFAFAYGDEQRMKLPHYIFLLLNLIAPVLIMTDFLDWSKRLKFTAFMEKRKLLALKIALCVACAVPICAYGVYINLR